MRTKDDTKDFLAEFLAQTFFGWIIPSRDKIKRHWLLCEFYSINEDINDDDGLVESKLLHFIVESIARGESPWLNQ